MDCLKARAEPVVSTCTECVLPAALILTLIIFRAWSSSSLSQSAKTKPIFAGALFSGRQKHTADALGSLDLQARFCYSPEMNAFARSLLLKALCPLDCSSCALLDACAVYGLRRTAMQQMLGLASSPSLPPDSASLLRSTKNYVQSAN